MKKMSTSMMTDVEKLRFYEEGRLMGYCSFYGGQLSQTNVSCRIRTDGTRAVGVLEIATYGEDYDAENGFGDTWKRITCYAVRGFQYGDKILITERVKIKPVHYWRATPLVITPTENVKDYAALDSSLLSEKRLRGSDMVRIYDSIRRKIILKPARKMDHFDSRLFFDGRWYNVLLHGTVEEYLQNERPLKKAA